MTADQRLATIENDLEAVKQLLASAARYSESANQGLDRLTVKVDSLAIKIDSLAAAQDRTQAQLSQLVESQSLAFTRLDRIERALDTLASNQVAEREARLALREDLETLYQTVQRSGENTDRAISQLTERVNQLTQNLTVSVQDLVGMIVQLANDAAQDRAIIRENQAEIRRIWEYLLRQSGNGSGG